MKKIAIIIISVLAVAFAGLLIYLLIFSKHVSAPSATSPATNQIQPLPTPTVPAGNTVTLNTTQGPVVVNNFFKNPVKVLESAVYLKDNANYSVVYFSNLNQFSLFLYATNAQDAAAFRSQAENDLLQALGISQANACKLSTDVEVANSGDPSLANVNYGLSFCPNGTLIAGASNTTTPGQINTR